MSYPSELVFNDYLSLVLGILEENKMDFVTGMAGNMLGDGKNGGGNMLDTMKDGGGNMLDNVKDKIFDTIMTNKDDILKAACTNLGLSVRSFSFFMLLISTTMPASIQ